MKLLCDAKDLPASECYCLLVALVIGFTLFSSNNCLYYILSLLEYTNWPVINVNKFLTLCFKMEQEAVSQLFTKLCFRR